MIRSHLIWLIVMSVVTACAVGEAGEQSVALGQIIDRYRSLLRLEEPSAVDTVRGYADRISQNGTWRDINYAGTANSEWQPAAHLRRIRLMALVLTAQGHAQQGDAKLRRAIELAVDHWCAKRYRASNWWWNQIGVPRGMRDIAVLLSDNLRGERRKGAIEVIGQHKMSGGGANLMWSAELSLHHGCLTGNRKQVARAAERIWAEVKVGKGDGIQRDWSFYQHGARLQTFHYGKAYLGVVSKISWQLRKTPWAIPPDKRTMVSDYVLEGVQWMCRGIHTVPGTLDRAVSRKRSLRSADVRPILRLWRDVDPERREGVDSFLASQKGKVASVTGYRHFPMADFTVYHRPEGSVFLKTISSRTSPTESINSENQKGVPYLHSGDHYVLRDGGEYSGLQPVWKWSRLPGLTLTKSRSSQERMDFVGGIGNGLSGLTAMDYVRLGSKTTVKVRKVWAFHENVVICLLGGWDNSELAGDVITAVEQCRLRGPVQTGVGDSKVLKLERGEYQQNDTRWILHHEIGYVPLGLPRATVYAGPATGSWHAISRRYSKEKVSEPVLRILLEHGANPQPAGFAIVLGADREKLDVITGKPNWEILRNDRQCQCVRFGKELCMAAFYVPTSIHTKAGLKVSKPCVAMWTQERLWLSDPTNQGSEVIVTWNGREHKVKMPGGGGVAQVIAADARRPRVAE